MTDNRAARKNGPAWPGDDPRDVPVDDFHGRPVLREVTMDVPTRYADDIAAACRAAGWGVRDSGLTVSTDDDEHALTTLLVDIPLDRASLARFPELRAPAPPPPPPPAPPAAAPAPPVAAAAPASAPDAPVPYLFHAIYSNRDLFLGDDVEVQHHVSAEGRVVVGSGARVRGRIRAGGDVLVKDGAVVGHVVSDGTVRLEGTARLTDAVEARGGLVRDVSHVTGIRAVRSPDEP